MSRLPLRLRVTAVFVAIMAAGLAAIGGFLYLHVKRSIDDSIAQSLRARQGALRELAGRGSGIPVGERFAQVLALDGTVLDGRPAGARPMLSPSQVRRAAAAPGFFEQNERVRFYAGPVQVGGRREVAVAATSLAEHERALEGLGGGLLIGGPLALLLAGAVAYGVASGALRPMEDLRRRAAQIGRADLQQQLPVPVADDEVRRLAETLNEMLARLAASAAAERRLIANASHELRTPLAALRAELELARLTGGSADELRAAIERAEGDVARLTALSSALLDVAREEELGAITGGTRVDVGALIAEVVAAHAAVARAAGRPLRLTEYETVAAAPASTAAAAPPAGIAPGAPGAGLSVHGDADALRRAVANLIDNALVHGQGAIAVGADLDGGDVVVWVTDEGTLAAATEQVAFERFARGRDATNRPGAGLGLALVRTIAERHGGTASLTTGPAGVRAELRLPSG